MTEKKRYFVVGRVTYFDEVEVEASNEEEARDLGGYALSALRDYTTDVEVSEVYENKED